MSIDNCIMIGTCLNINYFHVIVICVLFHSIRSVILQIQQKLIQKKDLSSLTPPCCATLQLAHPLKNSSAYTNLCRTSTSQLYFIP